MHGWEAKKTQKATEVCGPMDLAWAAGIYEGEGDCSLTAGQISITQKEPWILDRFQALFGGSIKRFNTDGRVYSRWSASGPRGRGFAMTIYQFLSPHRKARLLRYFG